jgi:serine O-acetyltransferase
VAAFEFFRRDLARYGSRGTRTWQNSSVGPLDAAKGLMTEPALWAIAEYRCRRWFAQQARPLALAWKVIGTLTRVTAEVLTGISIPTSAEIGPGFHIAHAGPVVVHGSTVAGENLTLQPQITIGAHRDGVPAIGDRVFIGPGARVLGGIHLGDEAVIGANAVVLRDVPRRHVATGVPAGVRPSDRKHWLEEG